MKKHGIIAVITAVLAIAALVVGCMDSQDSSNLSSDGWKELPPPPTGYSYVRINIADTAKTIYPTLPAAATYIAYFDATSSTDLEFVVNQGLNTVYLENSETYTLIVEAYSASGEIFAINTHVDTITGGQAQPVTVLANAWKEIDDGTAVGKFEWNITPPTGWTSCTFVVDRAGGGGTGSAQNPTITITNAGDLNNTASGGISINSGYYDVTLTFTRATYKDRVITTKMHIYQGMTSRWSDITNAANPYVIPAFIVDGTDYTVSFNINTSTYPGAAYTGTASDLDPINPVAHGGRLDASDEPLGPWTLPTPTGVYSGFAGWYNMAAAGTGTLWQFDATTGTRVVRSMTLYAHFTLSGSSLSLTINPFALPSAVTLNPATASISALAFEGNGGIGSSVITINIAAAAALLSSHNINAYTWKWEGNTLVDGVDGVTISAFGGVNTAQLEIDYMDAGFTDMGIEGIHVFSVEATDSGGKPWSAYFTITVTNPG